MDHWLQPLAQALPSYIKDSKSFIKIIESTPLPKDCILCTLDVSSLYTNIPTEEGMSAALRALKSVRNEACPPIEYLSRLLSLVLHNNVFRFDDGFYLQLQGTAMGNKMAPAYANIFMGELESRVLSTADPAPKLWKRYIDDIFLVWTDTKESLLQFIDELNDQHPKIRFTSEISSSEITFLDLCLYKGQRFESEGILDIKTHINPTNTQQYVHASSSHPPGTGKGLIKGEMLRYLRTNSSLQSFEAFRETHKTNVTSRGYSKKQFEEATCDISFADRPATLQDKQRDMRPRLTLCTTYTPYFPPVRIQRMLGSHWDTVRGCPDLCTVFPEQPKVAFRTSKSLKQMLVRARVQDQYRYHKINRDLRTLQGSFPTSGNPPLISKCNHPSCLTCSHLITTPYVRSLRKGTAHNLCSKDTLNCSSSHIIYVVTCTKCGVQYVGMTTQTLKARFSQHLREQTGSSTSSH